VAANTPKVNRFHPFLRGGDICQFIAPAAAWVDNLVLVAGTPQSYTPPTGTDPAGGAVTVAGPAGATKNATIFRITATGGPVWMNTNGGTAAEPTTNVTNGTASVVIGPNTPYWLSEPISGQPLSFFSDSPVIVAIEAWW
jgi:hypothetical protein